MTAIYAEVDSGHEDVFLVAGAADPYVMAEAAKRLATLTPLFKKSNPPGAMVLPLTWPAMVQLSATYGEYFKPGERLHAWITDQAARRTTTEPLVYSPPKGLTPRPYQVDGAQLIAATGRALIFDEPRTGKTITTILGVVEWANRRFRPGPVVVVCPASVVDPWVETWMDWAPHTKAVAWRGPKRHALAGTADVYVTSYDTARADAGVVKGFTPLLDLDPVALVIDESHLIKNHQAARSQAVRRIAKRVVGRDGAVVALSGTPITHHPADLWPALECIEPHAWPARARWVERYCDTAPEPGGYSEGILGLNRFTEPEFRLTLLGQHRRVVRADVMSQLPPKIYSVRTVDLPAAWRKAYDQFEAQMLAELPDESGELAVMDTLAKLTHLSTLASAPADVQVTEEVNDAGEVKQHVHLELKDPSWKVAALLEVLAERPGEQVVAYAPSRQLAMMAGAAAEKTGLRVGYIVGGQAQGARTATRKAFQSGQLDLICATTGAGGTGITLSAAGTLVFLQRPWSLVESLQAEDRAEGDMDATRGTEIVDIVARNTIDSRVRAVLRERAEQLSDLVQDPRIVAELLGGTSLRKAS